MQFMQVVPGLPFGTMFRALISGYNLTNVKVTGSNLAVPASGDATAGERRTFFSHLKEWKIFLLFPYCDDETSL